MRPTPSITRNRWLHPITTAALVVMAVVCLTSPASADGGILGAWNGVYPASQSESNAAGAGSSCMLCHEDTSPLNYNPYGWRIKQFKDSGMSDAAAVMAAMPFDSDGDPTGTTNDDECTTNTQPGYTPGPNNTYYSNNGSQTNNQLPPSGILGNLDPPMGTWTDLGGGKAGTGGAVPVLTGTGPLTDGSLNQVILANALPATTTTLVVGFANISVPFKGGTLVPSANILVGLPVDGTGGSTLPFIWPAGIPSGTKLYWQHWILDPGATFGLSASNGMESSSA